MSKVAAVTIKKQGVNQDSGKHWTMFQVETEEGIKATGFDQIHVGDYVEISQDGKFLNYKKVDKPKNGEAAQAPQAKPAHHGNLFTEYAGHAGRAFAAAWEESKNAMALIPTKDAEELTTYEWLDLRLRIASGFAIEINKIIRKERF